LIRSAAACWGIFRKPIVGLINCALSLSRQTGPAEQRSEAQTTVPA
jgi:hypothetical protein